VLADFGLRPKKAPTPLTVEEKAAAAAKRKATRVARNTMGSQQKKAVTGTFVGVVVTPIWTAPITPAPAAPNGPTPGPTGGTTPHTA
jgi:hypothetical protein